MRSKLMPKGRLRVGSFYFVAILILALTIGLIIGQISFNKAVDFRLHQLETQVSPVVIEPEVEATEEEVESPVAYLINDSERDIIERVVMSESMGEPYDGQVAVAQTILDRSVLWNKTPVEVVSQDSQYADMYPGEVSQSVKDAVSDVFDYGYRVFEEPTTHFHADYVNPYWAEVKTSRGTIGSHRFYY